MAPKVTKNFQMSEQLANAVKKAAHHEVRSERRLVAAALVKYLTGFPVTEVSDLVDSCPEADEK